MKSDINFFRALQRDARHKTSRKAVRPFPIVLTIVIAANVLLFTGFALHKNMIESQRAAAQATFEGLGVEQTLSDVEKRKQQILTAEKDLMTLAGLQKKVSSPPGFHSEMYQVMESVRPANVSIVSVTFSGGSMSIAGLSNVDSPPADFAKAIEQTGKFASVTYGGFSEEVNAATTAPAVAEDGTPVPVQPSSVYRFNITCTAKEEVAEQ